MNDPDRLADVGRRLVDSVRQGEPTAALASLARLDRTELEHLLLLLAAQSHDDIHPPVRDLVHERFAPTPRRH